jgi:hypothetical protein
MTSSTASATEPRTDAGLGLAWAHAVATVDSSALLALLSPAATLRAVTPSRFWDAETATDIVEEIVLGRWFGPPKRVTDLLEVSHDLVGGLDRVRYRLAADVDGTATVVEQVAYYTCGEGRITSLRLVCSGFRPRPNAG